MEVFLHAGLEMLVLSTAVIFGVIARRINLMNDEVDSKLSQIVMTFAIPCLILDSVLSNTNLPDSNSLFEALFYGFLSSGFVCLLAILIVRCVYRNVPKASKGAHEFIIAFGNTGQIGFAVLAAILGPTGVLYGAVCNIPYNVFMFSVGVVFILNSVSNEPSGRAQTKEQRKEQLKHHILEVIHQLISPCLISSFLAMFLAVYGITDSGYIGQTCELIAGLTIPASMLVIGSTLAKMPIKEMVNDGWSYVSSFLRLLVVPLVVFFVGGLFIQNQMVLSVISIQAAMPAAVAGTMLCLAYNGDALTVARGTFITTVLSLGTLPLIAMLVV